MTAAQQTGAPVTSAVIARIGSIRNPATNTGILVGDGRAPTGAGWQGAPGGSAFAPYVVVYPINHLRNGPDGNLSDLNAAPQWRYQITAVSSSRAGAETVLDLVAAALTSQEPLDIPGRTVVAVWHEMSAGVTVEETTNPPLFVGIDRYRIDT